MLAVQYAERIAVETPGARGIQFQLLGGEVLDQLLAIDSPRCRGAQRVQVQLDPLQAERSQQARAQQDEFCIDVGTGKAEGLRIELIELAEPSGLRPLVAEH